MAKTNESKSEPKKAKHKQGKYCGYDELPDGSIKLAPMYSDQFDRCHAERRAVNYVLKSITHHCQEILVPIYETEKAIWRRITEDYGIDPSEAWGYDGEGRIYRMEKEGAEDGS